MKRRDGLMLIAFGLLVLSLCFAMIGVWPILVSHLTPINWAMPLLVHFGVLILLASMYGKVSKGKLIERTEVLLTAGLVLMTWGADVSLIGGIIGR